MRDRFVRFEVVILFTIARHELYGYFRQRSVRRERLDFSVTSLWDVRTSASGQLVRREREAALERALEQLPLDDQILLELFYTEDMDRGELARVFEIEPSSVRTRLHRARAQLERLMRAARTRSRSRYTSVSLTRRLPMIAATSSSPPSAST